MQKCKNAKKIRRMQRMQRMQKSAKKHEMVETKKNKNKNRNKTSKRKRKRCKQVRWFLHTCSNSANAGEVGMTGYEGENEAHPRHDAALREAAPVVQQTEKHGQDGCGTGRFCWFWLGFG